MFGFRMKKPASKNTTDKEEIKKLIIKKVEQAEKLVSEIKTLMAQTELLQKKESWPPLNLLFLVIIVEERKENVTFLMPSRFL